MGITAGPSYTTPEGFTLASLYLSIDCFRLLKAPQDTLFSSVFTVSAYISRAAKEEGKNQITIPNSLKNVEALVSANDFYSNTLHGIAYDAIRLKWSSEGYTLSDVYEPGQQAPTKYIYDCSGFNFAGFNCAGFDDEGYDVDGFNAEGWNRQGYGRDGYNAAGYNSAGYNREGFNAEGYDYMGFNAEGYNSDGYDRFGYDQNGLDRNGNPRPVVDLSGNPTP